MNHHLQIGARTVLVSAAIVLITTTLTGPAQAMRQDMPISNTTSTVGPAITAQAANMRAVLADLRWQ